jgi:hypothetical protein
MGFRNKMESTMSMRWLIRGVIVMMLLCCGNERVWATYEEEGGPAYFDRKATGGNGDGDLEG